MNPPTNPLLVDYATPVARPRPPLLFRLTRQQLVVVGLIATVLAAIAFAGVKTVRTDIEAVSGSRVTQTTYAFGFQFSPPVINTSPVELRMRAMRAPWRPRWQHLNTKEYGLFGDSASSCCSTAPESYLLGRMSPSDLAGLPNADVVALVRILETGTRDEQHNAIWAAMERMFSGPASTADGSTATVPAVSPTTWAATQSVR